MAVHRHFLFALHILHGDLFHRPQNGGFLFVRSQPIQADLARQFDIDRQPVRQKSQLLHQQGVSPRYRLSMDIAVKTVLMAQNTQRLDHQFHSVVGGFDSSAGQKQPLNIIAPIKPNGQIGQFPGGKSRTRPIVAAAVDAVAAIVAARVRVQHLQKGNTPSVRRKGVADSGRPAAAQFAMLPGSVHTAGCAGHIIFGAVGKNFQFFFQIHKVRS